MKGENSLNTIDSIIFQLALQTRELNQKIIEFNQHVKFLRLEIAERKSYIETIHKNVKKLKEEIDVKQRNLMHNKENAKSMKASHSLLRQYEQMLKEALEGQKASYKHDMEVYEERLASCKKTFQLHKEHYCQHPLAQKLLGLQGEKEEIESRIKICDDEITKKQKELANLIVGSSSTEEMSERVFDQPPIKEPEKQLLPVTKDSSSPIDMSSIHLDQTQVGYKTSIEANTEGEENNVQDTTVCITIPGEASNEMWSCHQQFSGRMRKEQTWQEWMHIEEQEQGALQDHVLELQSSVGDAGEASGKNMEYITVEGEEEALSRKYPEALAIFPQTPQSKTGPSTPTSTFTFSPGSSPHQGTSDTKSPAFPFFLSSDPSPPVFPGFRFDDGSSQDEDFFTFTGSLFNEKKTSESKASSSPEFLFNLQEQSEDFQFTFPSKSPPKTNKDNSRDEFPFSFT